MKISSLVLLTTLLSGCVATTQQARRPNAADDPSTRCYQYLSVDEKLKPLEQKIGSIGAPDKATLEQMTSRETATEEDKRLLSLWASARQECAEVGRSFRAQFAPPGWVSAYESLQSGALQNIANLYSGQITYGQFITERMRLATVANAQFQDVSGRDNAARAQQAQIDQQRADAAMMFMLQQQQANKPINTTCNRFMNTVNCTTR